MSADIKTSATQSAHIEHVRGMSPMMAALSNMTDDYYRLAESDRLWFEFDGSK